MSASPAAEYPTGPCPPKDQIMNHIRTIFKEVGPHSLTMKILRLRLSGIYKIDFKEHTKDLSDWVQEVINEPATNVLLNESHKEQNKKVGGTRKSKSTTKKARGDDKKEDKKSKKKHKAEGEPKRALSAYFFFTNEKRPAVMEEIKASNDGKVDVAAVGKKIGEMWAAVAAEDKAKYEEMAVADKERYKKEYDAWIAGGGKKESGSKKSKKEKDPNAPKKATTAYFAYMAEVAPALREKSKETNNGKIDIAGVGKQVGALWNALSADEKKKYEDIAAEDKKRYIRECEERGIAVKGGAVGNDAAANDDDSSSSSSSDDE